MSVAGLIVEDSDISFYDSFCKALETSIQQSIKFYLGEKPYNIVAIDHMNFKKKCIKLKCEKVRN